MSGQPERRPVYGHAVDGVEARLDALLALTQAMLDELRAMRRALVEKEARPARRGRST